jgi:hypothetical protein
VVAAPDATLVGAHAIEDTFKVGLTMTVVVMVAPSVALTVTLCGVVTEPLDTVNAAEVEDAGTVTDAGTGSAALFDANATTLPPVGAAWLNVTVQVVEAPVVILEGAHASADTLGPPAPPPDAGLKAAICAM